MARDGTWQPPDRELPAYYEREFDESTAFTGFASLGTIHVRVAGRDTCEKAGLRKWNLDT